MLDHILFSDIGLFVIFRIWLFFMFIISATMFHNYRILISYIDIFSWSPDQLLVFTIFCMTELFSTLLIWLGVNPFFWHADAGAMPVAKQSDLVILHQFCLYKL